MGENKKVTIMVLKVDLQCEKCYRKVKKVLCKFPQIRDQKYDEKNNQVIIKVVCCNPEKIRDKICCKGRCVIKSIDIIEPLPVKPPPPPEPVKPPSPEPVKPPPPPEPVKPPPVTCKCTPVTCKCPPVTCKCPPVTCKCPPMICTCPPVIWPLPPVACPPVTWPRPPVTCPPVTWPRPPVKTCCTECYGGHPGGPCQTDCCRRPDVYDSCGGWRSYNTISYCVTRTDCFSEENPQACAIM